MPTDNLIKKIQKAREITINAGKFSFTVRRPTDLEMLYLRGQDVRQGDLLEKFVTGWFGVTELDLIPGGTGVPVDFDSKLFMEFVSDRPELWGPLANGIMDSYAQHRQKLDDALGEPNAG